MDAAAAAAAAVAACAAILSGRRKGAGKFLSCFCFKRQLLQLLRAAAAAGQSSVRIGIVEREGGFRQARAGVS